MWVSGEDVSGCRWPVVMAEQQALMLRAFEPRRGEWGCWWRWRWGCEVIFYEAGLDFCLVLRLRLISVVVLERRTRCRARKGGNGIIDTMVTRH